MILGLADLFPLILVGAVSALLTSPLLIRAATALDLVDIPGSAPHKRHPITTPLAGGPILASAVGITYLFLRPPMNQIMSGILIGCLLMVSWGIIDDRLNIKPIVKLLGQVAVAAVPVLFGIQVRITQVAWLDLAITFLWMVGMINAFNFVDSMDGLALGLAGIALAFFMLVTLDAQQPELAALAAACLGAAFGLYIFNASPARLFLGDSGAQLLGFALATIGIAYVPAQAGLPQGVSWFTPILVLGVPIFDATLVIVSRARRRSPIYRAQRDHTYHRLVSLGMHPARSVLTMQMTAVLLGLVAFVALGTSVLVANLVFGVIMLSGLVLLGLLERIALEE